MRQKILGTFSVLAVLAVWEFVAHFNASIVFFAGSPATISVELYKMVRHEQFYEHFLITGAEAALGFGIGTAAGASLGLLTWYLKPVAYLLLPIVGVIGALPILALAPLMIFWFGIGFWMKVALAVFATFFVSFSQALRGAQEVSQRHLEVFEAMRAPKSMILWKVVVPGSLGSVLNSMRLNASFCLLGSFIGEFIASERGLGYLILRSTSLYNMPRALAASIGILLLALVFHRIATWLEERKDSFAQLISLPRFARNHGHRS